MNDAHNHNHDSHDHDNHDHDHDHGDHAHVHAPGEVCVTLTRHDEAIIASGTLTLIGADEAAVYDNLARGLERVALFVDGADGIIGHIKASVSVTATSTMSVTDVAVPAHVTRVPDDEIAINAVAIVFGVDGDELAECLFDALEDVWDA